MRVSEIKIGNTYNNIKVLRKLGRINRDRKYLCKCMLCGKEFEVGAKHIGEIKSCRECSIKSKIVDLTGMRFGRLVALEYVGRKNGRTLWKCMCDCGNETITGYSNLVSGNTKSCGCMEYENQMKNVRAAWEMNRKSVSPSFDYIGKIRDHPLYGIYSSMITRCYNKNRKGYKDYGGRGIKVCDRWLGDLGFENFINDMGERPSLKHSIDRIDVNGDYCPENCRWATQKEQGNNKTTNVYLQCGDKKITASQLCEMLGLNYNNVIHQIKRGVDINYILQNQQLKRIRGNINYNRNITIDINIEFL